MKLIEAHITNFRSAEDSEPFKVEEHVTCLVGKNEAGKSAILLALAALNPHASTPVVFDRERDYPRRHLTAYAQRHKGEEAVAIHTKWKLFTVSDFTGKAESDIEDLFEIGLFAEIVNAAYILDAKYQLTGSTLDKADPSTIRLVKKAEAAFNVLPEPLPTYGHFTPSAWLIRNLAVLDAETLGIKETLDRAEKLFEAVNAVIEA